MSIVVIGTIYVDVKGYPLANFDPKGRNAGTVSEFHGGVGRNIAEDIANMELTPTFVSLADQTGSGSDVIEQLKRHKINTDYIRQTQDGMGTWLAIFDNDGDVFASISKRPNLRPILDILNEQGDEIFAKADSILLEMDIDHEIVSKAFELAEKYKKDVYGVISNMTIALERRDFIRRTACFICNQQEAGIFFSENYEDIDAETMLSVLPKKVEAAGLSRMIVTMGENGSVYVDVYGESGICPPKSVSVIDTTGAGDAFFAGACAGMTYGKSIAEASEIGTRLAAAVISTQENVCPRFLPAELGFI